MREIELTQGKVALIDDADYDLIKDIEWSAHREKHRWYAIGRYLGKAIKMHRMIMGVTDPNIKVDHHNGDGLYNMRSNLRVSTNSQNTSNGRPRMGFTSKYKGVHWDRFNNKWRVQVESKEHGVKRLGRFKNEVHAALEYNAEAVKIHGEFARLNLIDEMVIGENY